MRVTQVSYVDATYFACAGKAGQVLVVKHVLRTSLPRQGSTGLLGHKALMSLLSLLASPEGNKTWIFRIANARCPAQRI